MAGPAWHDVEMRGRRLEATCKHMNTLFYNFLADKNYDMALAFHDRLTKTEQVIKPYIEQFTGVKALLKEGTEKNENPLYL